MIFLDNVYYFPPWLLLFTKTFLIKLLVFWTGKQWLPEYSYAALKITEGPYKGLRSPDYPPVVILIAIFSWYDLDEYEIEDGDTTGGDRKSNVSFAFGNLGYCKNNNNINNNKTLFHNRVRREE